MKIKSIDVILAATLLVTVVSGFAFTWQQTSGPIPFGTIRMSADGRIICAVNSGGHPAISTDSGQTWFSPTTSPFGAVLFPSQSAMSADGSKIYAVMSTNIAVGTSVYISADHGT